MLTLESILRTQKQMSAFGEGRHRFGLGCEKAPKTKTIESNDKNDKKAAP